MGYQALLKENYKDSLLNLRKADIILNAYVSNDGRVSQNILIFVKMNLGICFYKIGLLEEAYTCLETCIRSLKNKGPNTTNARNKSLSQPSIHDNSEYFISLANRMAKRKVKI